MAVNREVLAGRAMTLYDDMLYEFFMRMDNMINFEKPELDTYQRADIIRRGTDDIIADAFADWRDL